MAKPELGAKRQCLHCGSKFYDLNRDPIICPKCGTTFALAAVATALARPEPVAARAAEQETELDTITPDVLVPLEEADVADDAKVTTGEDIDLEEEAIEDDTFLEPEEDEDDGDVADLIDGDIEEEDET